MSRIITLALILTIFMPKIAANPVSAIFGDGKNSPLIVNIDNPNFRKLVIAVPDFFVKGDGPAAAAFAKEAPKMLTEYLQFSGIFNVIADAAYSDLYKQVKVEFLEQDEGIMTDPSKTATDGVDMTQWKGIGVESLVLGETTEEPGGSLTFKFHLYDIQRGKKIGGRKFSGIIKSDYVHVMRRVANLIMEAYTGEKGVFRSKIVFIGRKHKSSQKQVYVCDFDGSNVTQITNTQAVHVSPHWSPDGAYLTFTSYEHRNPDLFLYELASGKKTKIAGKKGLNSGGQWAPNGNVIAFTGSEGSSVNIFTMRKDGSDRKVFIKGDALDVDPTFSPDGKFFAFVSGRFGNPHIFLGTLEWADPFTPKVVADKRLTFAGWYNATPAWSPDSEKILFGGYDRDINRWDIFMMNRDGTKLERLTLKAGDNESPDWAPNGQMIVFNSNRVGQQNIKGRPQLFIMNRDGSGQRQLDVGLYEAQTPDWSSALY